MKIPLISKILLFLCLWFGWRAISAQTLTNDWLESTYHSNLTASLLEFPIKPLGTAQVFVADQLVIVQTRDHDTQILAPVDSFLWHNHANRYVLASDYNLDGFQDIALLSSMDAGGTHACYRVYYFQPPRALFLPRVEGLQCIGE